MYVIPAAAAEEPADVGVEQSKRTRRTVRALRRVPAEAEVARDRVRSKAATRTAVRTPHADADAGAVAGADVATGADAGVHPGPPHLGTRYIIQY